MQLILVKKSRNGPSQLGCKRRIIGVRSTEERFELQLKIRRLINHLSRQGNGIALLAFEVSPLLQTVLLQQGNNDSIHCRVDTINVA